MEFKFAPELDSFREEVRRFVEEKIPDHLRERTRHEAFELTNEEQKAYVRLLNEQGGWSCPPWPEEHGGPGWSQEQQYVFERELAHARCATGAAVWFQHAWGGGAGIWH